MIQWYLKVVRDNYANFEGRARRSEYWYYTLMNILIIFTLAILTMVSSIFTFVYAIYALGVIIPGLAVAVRRLHDINKSGWFILVGLIPVIGSIWLLVLFATEGDRGDNQYGADPKNPYNEMNEIGEQQA
ncbi:DUF805 domain-containing protein [Flavobacterium alkalisoli]|uniref:DUF805 domain-containing protein n=1 Tax=Flavobacterium alkalisoli TaxID=2602769 RepID=A0A5B9FV01_9FLAO|nr:DUF805 domain-containing protein [Flavobacterium alkalisoli]QEE48572.1 DUF805 domain-containing protein [Flavobacterium alkalisoli]